MRKVALIFAPLLLLALVLAAPAQAAAKRVPHGNPVLAGDWPDPTVAKVGKEYVASATSNGWAPIFRILRSRDLVHWKLGGAVFRSRPRWAAGNFWAPEFARVGGRYLVYYAALPPGPERDFCIGVGVSRRIGGPYRDRGPILCPPTGAIDPFPVRDEQGRLNLLWKEDGTATTPTTIRGAPLTPDGLHMAGAATTLIRADKPWERGIVEGAAVMRRKGIFYLFWAGSGCCDTTCRYGEGVARSRSLLGPWEERRRNPILRGSRTWRCPGHGTPIRDPAGHTQFLYHAFRRGPSYLAGRQLLLDPIGISRDGWPSLGKGVPGPGRPDAGGPRAFGDDFGGHRLARPWEWPAIAPPRFAVKDGDLILGAVRRADSPPDAAILSRRTTTGRFDFTVRLPARRLGGGVNTGAGATSGRGTSLFLSVGSGTVRLLQNRGKALTQLAASPLPRERTVTLRMRVNGSRFGFSVRGGDGPWRGVGATQTSFFSTGVRVGLFAGGRALRLAHFDSVRYRPR